MLSLSLAQNQWVNYTSGKYVMDVQVNDQYVWASTTGGLVRIEKSSGTTEFYNFVNSPLTSNSQYSVELGPNNDVWVLAGNSIFKIVADDWVRFDSVDQTLPQGMISLETTQSGDMWIYHEEGLMKISGDSVTATYDENDWTVLPFSSEFTSFGNDSLWFTSNFFDFSTISMFDGTEFQELNVLEQDEDVYDIMVDSDMNTWFATTFRLIKYDGEVLVIYDSTNSPVGEYNYSLAAGDDGEVYLSNLEEVFMIDTAGNWTSWDMELEGNESIRSIAFDGSNLYAGTSVGLKMLEGEDWTDINTSNSGLPDNDVHDFAHQGLKTLIGTTSGLAVVENNEWVTYDTTNSRLPSNEVYSVAFDNSGSLWAGTAKGVARLTGDEWTVWTSTGDDGPNGRIPWENIRDILIDRDGKLWFADDKAIRYMEDDSVMFLEGSWMETSWSSFVQDTTGWMWILSMHNGLYYYDGNEIAPYIDAPSQIDDLTIDSSMNILWMGSVTDGLYSFDRNTFTNYTMDNSENQLSRVYSVLANSRGMVWMIGAITEPARSVGLAKFYQGNFEFFGDSLTGMPLEFGHSLSIDRSNNIWFAGEGVIVFNEGGLTVEVDDIPTVNGNNIAFWPNPVNDNLQLRNNTDILRVELYTTSGKLIFTTEPRSPHASISLSGLPSGVYLLNLLTSEGVKVVKVIKK